MKPLHYHTYPYLGQLTRFSSGSSEMGVNLHFPFCPLLRRKRSATLNHHEATYVFGHPHRMCAALAKHHITSHQYHGLSPRDGRLPLWDASVSRSSSPDNGQVEDSSLTCKDTHLPLHYHDVTSTRNIDVVAGVIY